MNFLNTCMAAAAAVTIAGAAHAATVVNGSFEDTPDMGGKSWRVFDSIDGWNTTSGAGIEIQSGVVMASQDGSNHVELDSHGSGSNSTMAQSIFFKEGTYRLSFYYAPRTNNATSNGIQFAVGDYLLGSVSGPDGTYARKQWSLVQADFEVTTGGYYDLSFSATGRQDTYGGLIDNVSLSEVPLPASAMLLLGGLAGFGALRRKKS